MKIISITKNRIIPIFALAVCVDLHAKITIVSDNKAEFVAPIEIPNPSRLNPSASANTVFNERDPALVEFGLQPLGSDSTPDLFLEKEPLINILINLIPQNIPLYLSKDTDFKKPIDWDSNEGESWVKQLERVSLYNNLSTIIDWNNQIVQISNANNMMVSKSSQQYVQDDSGEQYVIRKLKEDIDKIQQSGFLIKNGQPVNVR